MSDRKNFGKLKEVIQPPNLIQNQIDSYTNFLQADVPARQRTKDGLEAVFSEVFPIENYDGRCTLHYLSYTLGEAKSTETECIRDGITYSISLYVKSFDWSKRTRKGRRSVWTKRSTWAKSL